MREELESVNGTYGTREELPFDISVHYDLSMNGLADIFLRVRVIFYIISDI